MKNLKKTLAVVLAFAMVLSMGFSAFAYTDVTAGTKVAEAVTILSNLGIFEGFEDGTFKPNDTVTRAQMAAIICRTLGYEDQALASAGTTNFNDVPASHWASGYINVSEGLQIVNGYGDGKFGPEDQVTYEQAIKMIVVALGYELDAQAKGGWYTGYLAVAAREGITRNSNGVVGTPAARGTIAVLVYNSLEVRLMDQSVWTPVGEEDEFKRLDETILSRYLGIDKVEGVLESTPIKEYAVSYNAHKDAEVTFANNSKRFYYSGGIYQYGSLNQYTYDSSLLPEADLFAGKKVVAYVGQEIDEETGKYMVYAIAEKPGANTVVTINNSQLAVNTAKEDVGYVNYKDASGSKAAIVLDNSVPVMVNYAKQPAFYADSTEDLDAKISGGATLTFISNDTDKNVDLIIATEYTAEAVVETVTTDDGVAMFECLTGHIDDIDTLDEDRLDVVIKDGAVATVADIAAGDTVSYVTLNNNFSVYYVSSKTVTGTASRYNRENSIVVGGEKYFASLENNFDLSDINSKEVTMYLNVDGQVVYAEAVEEGNYGIFVAAGTGTGLDSSYAVEVALADGESGTYNLRDKVRFDGATLEADVAYGRIAAKMHGVVAGTSNKRALPADIAGLAYKVVIKDNKITAIQTITAGNGATGDKKYDEENLRYGGIFFDEDTVVVSVGCKANATKVKVSDLQFGKVSDYFVDGEGGSKIALNNYDVDKNGISGLVIGTGLTNTISQKESVFVVQDYNTYDNEDGYLMYEVIGYQGGKEAVINFSTEKENIQASNFAAGNVILPGVVSADGVAYDLEVLFKYNTKALTNNIGDEEDEYYLFGTLDETKEPKAGYFFLNVVDSESDKNGAPAFGANEEITMLGSANYTLVDFSEGEVELSRKSKGTGLFSRYNGDYDYEVFVRYYDDAMVDVVVYRNAQ